MTERVTTQIFRPAGFFVLRSPLLPFATFTGWGGEAADLSTREAWEQSQVRTRDALREHFESPVLREAVFVASPDLDMAIAEWWRAPLSDKGQRAERSLVRYFARMCTRATPFGLFAGCSLGEVGVETAVTLCERVEYQRHTRLDMEYVASLVAELERSPDLRRRLVYHPNSSLYRTAGRVRYVEAVLRDRTRSHRLVAVDTTEYLDATLARAAHGATLDELATALVDDDVTNDEAHGFVEELVDAQLLVSSLEPTITGGDPLLVLVQGLRDAGGETVRETVAVLEDVARLVGGLDQQPTGQPSSRYGEIATRLEPLGAEVKLPRLFQVDMVKPVAGATLGLEVINEIQRGVRVLDALMGPARETPLEQFRERFVARYEGREVALEEALDEEGGIGFDRSSAPSAEASPLLRDITFPNQGELDVRWSKTATFLTKRLATALGAGEKEIAITLDEALGLKREDAPPLPTSMAVTATLSSTGEVRIHAAVGPSGARMLGRFCQADPELLHRVRTHLEHEAACQPEAVFAEVVHLPEGRIGNIVQRPRLRDYELPYLARSSAPAERQVPTSDLTVSVSGNRIVLRSRRLGREVIPRMSNAHNYQARSIGMYRFLCSLQDQGVSGQLTFDWGVLQAAPFLPRVVSGRVVLSRARWRLLAGDLKPLDQPDAYARWEAAQALRTRLGLPRLLMLADADNELCTDLDNPLSVETLVQLVVRRPEASLTEVFPAPDQLWVNGPEGVFASEVVVPFEIAPHTPPAVMAQRGAQAVANATSYPPGSEWLFLKLYCGTSTADHLLRELVGPLIREWSGSGIIDRWFFIRYADPDWHLRLRLHGDPAALVQLLPEVRLRVAPLLANASLGRLALDTYAPEDARYGGAAAMPLVEEMFEADSEAVLGIVELLSGDAGMDARWRLVVRGADMLLEDLGLDIPARRALMRGLRDSYRAEFAADGALKGQIGDRFRDETKALRGLLLRQADGQSDLLPGLELLSRRSERIRPLAARLHALDAGGSLVTGIPELAASLVHMHANRLLRSAARAQELVIYDFLDRFYLSMEARG